MEKYPWQRDSGGKYEWRTDSTGGYETRPIRSIQDEKKQVAQIVWAILIIAFLVLVTYLWSRSGDGSSESRIWNVTRGLDA